MRCQVDMDFVHGYYHLMITKTLPAGAFKQTCLREMEQVRSTGEPLLVTKRGEALVMIVPVRAEPRKWAGAMRGTGEMRDNLVESAAGWQEWRVSRDGEA